MEDTEILKRALNALVAQTMGRLKRITALEPCRVCSMDENQYDGNYISLIGEEELYFRHFYYNRSNERILVVLQLSNMNSDELAGRLIGVKMESEHLEKFSGLKEYVDELMDMVEKDMKIPKPEVKAEAKKVSQFDDPIYGSW